MALPLVPFTNFSNTLILMEYFRGQQLEDAIGCSHKFASLLEAEAKEGTVDVPLLEHCADHPQMKLDLFCKQCGTEICTKCTKTSHEGHKYTVSSDYIHDETQNLGKTINSVTEVLKDMKQAISKIKEMKQKVNKRKDDSINKTKEVFAILRKAINEREEQTIVDIKETAYKRERALEVAVHAAIICTCMDMHVCIGIFETYLHMMGFN